MYVDVANKTESMPCKHEAVRYVLNGLFATVIHFSVLTLNMQLFDMQSAALANGLASIVGIFVSFIGSKFYVFRKYDGKIAGQAFKFFILYICVACVHVGILFLWSDFWGLRYQVGFMIAMIFQVSISFYGNKLIVFK